MRLQSKVPATPGPLKTAWDLQISQIGTGILISQVYSPPAGL